VENSGFVPESTFRAHSEDEAHGCAERRRRRPGSRGQDARGWRANPPPARRLEKSPRPFSSLAWRTGRTRRSIEGLKRGRTRAEIRLPRSNPNRPVLFRRSVPCLSLDCNRSSIS
jgi:hypothetical protein